MMGAEHKPKEGRCFCPYCDQEIEGAFSPYCGACKVTIFYCPKCRKPLSRDNRVCPHCRAEIKG